MKIAWHGARAQEVCESRGGRPGLLVLNSPDGLCMDLTRRSIVSETRINVSGETIAAHVKLESLSLI